MNLTAEQARSHLVIVGGRIESARETLRHVIAQEPRLKWYLDSLERQLRTTAWEVRQAGQNLDLLYTKVWPPLDLGVDDLVVSAEPLRVRRFTRKPQ